MKPLDLILDFISLLGGLAMFLYGMKLMGNGLRESSSGTLKVIMERVTNNPIKGFLLGLFVTALIQSSTATIVITSGLVGAGVISLSQSLGIIIGANVGTTITGQIIRLMDVDSSGTSWLEFLKPSTLAPIALIAGIILIMFLKFKNSDKIGNIIIGFGILFIGLMNMTGSVGTLQESGIFENVFTSFSEKPILGYIAGAGVAFILQSSSSSIGILQALSMTGCLSFKAVYAVIVGIYLGDCVTTAIVCSIGAKTDTKRVGVVNILFNLGKTVAILVAVTILHSCGVLDGIWDKPIFSGGIANANTLFNLGSALVLIPFIKPFENLSKRIVVEKEEEKGKYDEIVTALSPAFFATPAIALRECKNALLAMMNSSINGINRAIDLCISYDQQAFDEINEEEDNIDMLMDKVSSYLVNMSPHISLDAHVRSFDEYCKVAGEFERLGDHAVNIAEYAQKLASSKKSFSKDARKELEVIKDILDEILSYTAEGFTNRDTDKAKHIEPLEQVVDDIVDGLRDNHLARLREGKCDVTTGTLFLDILSNVERISDVCSNIGLATVARVFPDANEAHNYTRALHAGEDEWYNGQFVEARDRYFARIKGI